MLMFDQQPGFSQLCQKNYLFFRIRHQGCSRIDKSCRSANFPFEVEGHLQILETELGKSKKSP
jgi:hypothetical protein